MSSAAHPDDAQTTAPSKPAPACNTTTLLTHRPKPHNRPSGATTSPFPSEPHPAWVAFFAEALRLEQLALQRRAARLQAEQNAASDASAPDDQQPATEIS